ncbi:GPP34 family phosphoprotein [Streptomyces sp. NPDC046985]|uniref:GPP34 family phosphoprotein n=1 Tax=Streptomyces sp. NPDC046985 TaxID=3155377 RepID=UPI0033E95197
MTTPRDLLILSLDVPSSLPVQQGDLSLALAGAELSDLLTGGLLSLDDDRVVPGPPADAGDRLLDEAAAALVRDRPYESVQDWLWRRGDGLAAAYASDLRARGAAADAEHGTAAARWTAQEPVLAGLAAAAGIGAGEDGPADEGAVPQDDALATVLAAVHEAVTELEAVRQRRSIEEAAFDNIWRAP